MTLKTITKTETYYPEHPSGLEFRSHPRMDHHGDDFLRDYSQE